MSGFNSDGAGFGSQLLGMIGGHQQDRRNYRDQRNLMNLQMQNQAGLNRQGHDLQMDMWNKTNYGAQVGHMRDAGLNPALMYKGAGAGGTTGSQGGGSASMGNKQQGKVMDMSNLMMGAQIEKLKEEVEHSKWTRGEKGDSDIGVNESTIGLNKAKERGTKAQALLNEELGNAIKENKKAYVDGLIGEWSANASDAGLKKIALGMSKNGIHNKEIGTILGVLTGWDLTKPGVLDEQVGILPDALMNALESAGMGEFKPTMSRRTLLQSAVGMYMAGQLALKNIKEIFGAIGDVVTTEYQGAGGNKSTSITTKTRN